MSNKITVNKFFFWIYTAVLILLIIYLVFSGAGFIKYLRLQDEVDELKSKLESSHARLEILREEVDSLKQSRKRIEELAREKYNMKKENETSIRIKEE